MKPCVHFSQEIADRICDEIAGGKSLRAICQQKGMPTRKAVDLWLGSNEAFRAQYAHARSLQADFYADQIVEIADKTTDPIKARLQIDARKWTAAKLLPKKYGERILNEHSGPDGGPVAVKWLD